jgi:hypothetical protein
MICLYFIAATELIALTFIVRMHVRDRQHGRVPGTVQPQEYVDWIKSGKRWDWRDIVWPR